MTIEHSEIQNNRTKTEQLFYQSNIHQISHIQNKKEVNGIIYFGQVHICFSLGKYKMTFSFAELEYICYCICAH